MEKIILLNKKEGETPLQALTSFRVKNKEYKDTSMTYAGRLDPMASGLLIILAGEEVKKKEKYLALNKEYEFEVLFGFATDTYDILGKIVRQGLTINPANARQDLAQKIRNNLKHFIGTFIQKYPLYSSKTVNGKQLFQYGRAGVDVEQPTREVKVSSLKFLKLKKINSKKLLANIEKRIKKVTGDFRQQEISKLWRKKLISKKPQEFLIGFFQVKCSSGTYVRAIANSLGEKIDIPVLAFKIKRTKIGKFSKIT